jgi:hypothetical protein
VHLPLSVTAGRFFAIHEIKLVLVSLLKEYDIELRDKMPVDPVIYAIGMFALPNETPIVISPRK